MDDILKKTKNKLESIVKSYEKRSSGYNKLVAWLSVSIILSLIAFNYTLVKLESNKETGAFKAKTKVMAFDKNLKKMDSKVSDMEKTFQKKISVQEAQTLKAKNTVTIFDNELEKMKSKLYGIEKEFISKITSQESQSVKSKEKVLEFDKDLNKLQNKIDSMKKELLAKVTTQEKLAAKSQQKDQAIEQNLGKVQSDLSNQDNKTEQINADLSALRKDISELGQKIYMEQEALREQILAQKAEAQNLNQVSKIRLEKAKNALKKSVAIEDMRSRKQEKARLQRAAELERKRIAAINSKKSVFENSDISLTTKVQYYLGKPDVKKLRVIDGKYNRYVVKPGDDIQKLAKVLYGTPNAWAIIYKQNPWMNPYQLVKGSTLKIPRVQW